jgi:excisionase family DNA binding protein
MLGMIRSAGERPGAAMVQYKSMLTVDQAAAQLHVKPETVRRWLRSGRLPGSRRIGTRLGWQVSAVDVKRLLRPQPRSAPQASQTAAASGTTGNARSDSRSRRRFCYDDSLIRLIGIGAGPDEGIHDVSENVDRYLAASDGVATG